MKINYIDVFSGIGGFALGLQKAGIKFEKHYYSEIEEYAIKVYQKNFPKAKAVGDVSKAKGRNLGSIDLLSAGSPCQDISIAGNQEGIDGSRSRLFFEIIRLAKIVSPRIIFLENVANLLGSNGGRDMGTVLGELAEIGYDSEWDCIPASYVGASHQRDRIWIIAYPRPSRCGRGSDNREKRQILHNKNRNAEKSKQKRNGRKCGLGSFSPDVADTNGMREPQQKRSEQDKRRRISHSSENAANSKNKLPQNSMYTRSRGTRLADSNQWTIEPDVGRVAHGVPSRVDRLKGLGNAVVPQVVEYVTQIKIIPILKEMRNESIRR